MAVGWGRVALGEEAEVGEGDGCYISVFMPCFMYLFFFFLCWDSVMLTGCFEKIPRKPNPYRY